VLRWVDAAGRGLERIGLEVPLSETSLLRGARRVTRLSDFGDEEFRVPLRRLLQAHAEEARLSPSGRLIKRVDLIDMLANRLRVHREVGDHPGILDDTVRDPIVVTGLPRTGTTLLQRLLSLDPRARPLLSWEAMWPAPISRRRRDGPDPRVRHVRRLIWAARRVMPGIDRLHPLDPEGPEECTRLLDGAFRWGYFAIERRLPGYAAWLEGLGSAGMEPAYRWYALQLKVLQHQRPPAGHWVLKSPAHLRNLRALLDVIPNSRVVLATRDPREVVASACSLFALLQGTSERHPRTDLMGPGVAESLARDLTRGLEVAAAEPRRVQVVRYADLVERPVETLREIYAGFGLPFPDALDGAASAWLAANPPGLHGVHRYDLESYGLDEESVERLFSTPELVMRRIGRSSRK